jgi:hypothetical protein
MAGQSGEVETGSAPATTQSATDGSDALPNATNMRAMKAADAVPPPPNGLSATPPRPSEAKTYSLLGIEFNPAKPALEVQLNPWLAAVLIAAVIGYFLAHRGWRRSLKSFEIEKAELGIGAGKITLRPNEADRQVAYQIWVELSTRKIGLPIDLQNDVVAEIYNSWHQFFTVTRDLIKSVPVSRAADDSTRKIINLSIEVLNEGLRPHLTLWQARFRAWYDQQLNASTGTYVEPQDLQAKFPRFQDLSTDLMNVNQNLVAYRAAMRRIVYDD